MISRISTIIPCYNHGDSLTRAVESVSSGRDDFDREIIIVDDGSTDNTPARCAKAVAADIRDRLLRSNLGPVHSFIVRRQAVDAAGFFDEALTSCEDWDYWLRIALSGFAFAHVPHVFAYYERPSGMMSRNYPVMIRNAKAVLAKAVRHTTLTSSKHMLGRASMGGMRRGLFDAAYAGVLQGHLEAGRFAFIARETLRLMRADPASTWLMLYLLVHHKRAIARGLGLILSRSFSPADKPRSL